MQFIHCLWAGFLQALAKRMFHWLARPFMGGCAVLVCLSALFPGLAAAQDGGVDQPIRQLAVVIDDLGNNMAGTEEIMSLHVPVTVAIMPFLPSTKQDAIKAHERGYDVLVHLPMEPLRGKPEWLGPGAIKSSMSDEEVRRKVNEAIDNVPYAVGVNNHMGSKITSNPRIMSAVLDVCKERGLFFLDSRTDYRTVVGKLCKEKGMPVLGNDIFLDDVHTTSHIQKQIKKVELWFKNNTQCIVIGHVGAPGPKTSRVIKQSIPALQNQVQFVKLSQIVKEQGEIRIRELTAP